MKIGRFLQIAATAFKEKHSYLLVVTGSLVLLLTICVWINYTANVYGVYDTAVDDSVQDAMLFDNNTRLAKAHIVRKFSPQAVILGTSRAEVGLSPTHSGWRYHRVYNLGLPSATIYEVREYLRHVIASGELKQVVLAVDYFQFNPSMNTMPGFSSCRLLESRSALDTIVAELCDLPNLLLSKKGLVTALFTIGSQSQSGYLKNGSRGASAKLEAFEKLGSQHIQFLKNEYHYSHDAGMYREFQTADFDLTASTGKVYVDILEMCHAKNIDLRILISPVHARQLEVIADMGLWQSFVDWKRYLVFENKRVGAEHGNPPFDLWDFADYSDRTQTDPPLTTDTEARLKWYWESSHYTKQLGSIVLDRVLLNKNMDFGERLNSDNVESWLKEVESRRHRYRVREDETLKELRAFVSSDEDLDLLLSVARDSHQSKSSMRSGKSSQID